jgi:hypothetical protein
VRTFLRSGSSFFVITALVACGSAPPAPATPPTAAPSATAPAASYTPTPFDRAAAKTQLDAVDPASCNGVPPFQDEGSVHVKVTFAQNGTVLEVAADGAFRGTPAGKCVEDLFRKLRVPAFDGNPVTLGKSVAHTAGQGDASAPPFDPRDVRAAAANVDLSDCADAPGGGEYKGHAQITVATSGEVKSVFVDSGMSGTPRAMCVQRLLGALKLAAYSGNQAGAVGFDFEVKEKKKKP